MNKKTYYPLIDQKQIDSKHSLSLQLVMEYCLGSASDLLEGELETFETHHHCTRLHVLRWEVSLFKFILDFCFLIDITVGECISSSSQETSARS